MSILEIRYTTCKTRMNMKFNEHKAKKAMKFSLQRIGIGIQPNLSNVCFILQP